MSTLRKEILVPLIVSLLGGILLISYERYMYGGEKETPNEVAPIEQTAPSNVQQSTVAEGEIRAKRVQLNTLIAQAHEYLNSQRCEEARQVIAQIVWDLNTPDTQDLANFDKIRTDLEAKAQVCLVVPDGFEQSETSLEAQARKEAEDFVRQKQGSQDVIFDKTAVSKKIVHGEGSINISYLYEMHLLLNNETKNEQVEVKTHIPLLDGKVGEGIVDRVLLP